MAKVLPISDSKFRKTDDVSAGCGILAIRTNEMIQVIPSIAIRKGRVVKMRKGDPTSEKAATLTMQRANFCVPMQQNIAPCPTRYGCHGRIHTLKNSSILKRSNGNVLVTHPARRN
jgi:hypothetical protein